MYVVSAYACMHACTCVCMYVCICVCMYVCMDVSYVVCDMISDATAWLTCMTYGTWYVAYEMIICICERYIGICIDIYIYICVYIYT